MKTSQSKHRQHRFKKMAIFEKIDTSLAPKTLVLIDLYLTDLDEEGSEDSMDSYQCLYLHLLRMVL